MANTQPPQQPPQPNTNSKKEEPQSVWAARPVLPDHPEIPAEALRHHEESVRKYPELNLSKGEFVISAVRRHPIGLLSIWFVAGLIILLSLVILGVFAANGETFFKSFGFKETPSFAVLSVPFFLLTILVIIGALVSTYVYTQNKFFLTNESVVQFIQISLFSLHEQTVSLSNIEDASYRQQGILQHIFNYGNIRLSTQGEETTYRFAYVSNPKRQIALLNNAVEAFKMGRPVTHPENPDSELTRS